MNKFANICCPGKNVSYYIACIEVHYSLDLMEANDLTHDQNDPIELSQTIYIGYLST